MSSILKRVAIISNGSCDDAAVAARLRLWHPDIVLCADGGVRHARQLGWTVHGLVGDFDSLPPAEVDRCRCEGTEVRCFPVEKDATDTELAIAWALELGATDLLLLGATGSRLDHTLATLLLLPPLLERGVRVRLLDAHNDLILTQGEAVVEGEAGDLVSLLPLTPEVSGITTTGLKYPLANGSLKWGSALGVSNVMLGPRAHIQVRSGCLAVVRAWD